MLATLVGTGCDRQRTLKFGLGEVRCDSEISDAEARVVADLLHELDYFDAERERTIRLLGKESKVQFVTVDSAWSDPKAKRIFAGVGRLIAGALGRATLDVALLDSKLEVRAAIGSVSPFGVRHDVGKGLFVYLEEGASSAAAEAFAERLREGGWADDEVIYRLSGDSTLHVGVRGKEIEPDRLRSVAIRRGWEAAKAFGADKARVQLLDGQLRPTGEPIEATPPGEHVEAGPVKVYYRGGMSKDRALAAARLGEELRAGGPNGAALQLIGASPDGDDPPELRYIATGTVAEIPGPIRAIGVRVASEIGAGKIRVTRSNDLFEPLGPSVVVDSAGRSHRVRAAQYVYLRGDATDGDATRFLATVTPDGLFTEQMQGAVAWIDRKGAEVELGLMLLEGKWDEEPVRALFAEIGARVRTALDADTLVVTLADETLVSRLSLPPIRRPPPDPAAERKRWEQACGGGDDAACGRLGEYLYTAGGNHQSDTRAFPLLEKGCRAGRGESCLRKGLALEFGSGTAVNYPKAAESYRAGCDRGFVPACSALGVCYRDGIGVETDGPRALKLLEGACTEANPLGCYNLGVMLEFGRGVKADTERARELFGRACDGDVSRGCYELAMSLERVDAAKNPSLIESLFARGCTLGYKPACDRQN